MNFLYKESMCNGTDKGPESGRLRSRAERKREREREGRSDLDPGLKERKREGRSGNESKT